MLEEHVNDWLASASTAIETTNLVNQRSNAHNAQAGIVNATDWVELTDEQRAAAEAASQSAMRYFAAFDDGGLFAPKSERIASAKADALRSIESLRYSLRDARPNQKARNLGC